VRHAFVIYHDHRKSLWQTDDNAKAAHLLSFLLTTGADFNYYPPN
jgi:hypothetical protein